MEKEACEPVVLKGVVNWDVVDVGVPLPRRFVLQPLRQLYDSSPRSRLKKEAKALHSATVAKRSIESNDQRRPLLNRNRVFLISTNTS